MRNKSAFYRTDEVSREPRKEVSWLDSFAEELAVEESIVKNAKTAVEVARERQTEPSIYEMMSSIISNQKPKFSSVEEAVKDYQQRTGLSEYLERTADERKQEKLVVAALEITADDEGDPLDPDLPGDPNDPDLPPSVPGGDQLSDNDEADDVADIDVEPDISLSDDSDDSDDADDSSADDELKKKDLNDVKWNDDESRLEAVSNEAQDKPDLIKNHPAIENFVSNMIETNYGVQVPALLHSIIETFGRDGVSYNMLMDRDFLQWLNSSLTNASDYGDKIPSDIGRGVGIQIDYHGENDPNKDPFATLVPDKGMF